MSTGSDANTGAAPRVYETDYYGWIEDQIVLLRAGRLSEIDAQNIADEIKDVGSRQYDLLENAVQALVYNLLKWDLLPDRRSNSMVFSIDAHRDQVARLLKRSPSLAAEISGLLPDAYLYATFDMMRDSDLPESTFLPDCPYDWETIRFRSVVFDNAESPSASEFS